MHLNSGLRDVGESALPLQKWGSEAVPSASCRAGHRARPGKG